MLDPLLPLSAHCFILIKDIYESQLEHVTLLTRQLVLIESYCLSLEVDYQNATITKAELPNVQEYQYCSRLLNVYIENIPKIDLPYRLNLICIQVKVNQQTANAITALTSTIVAGLFSAWMRYR